MSTDSEDKFLAKKRKAYINRRSVMDFGMGLIIAGFGVFFAVSDKLGFEFSIDPILRYAFAGLCLIYGLFRIYRGYKKNYFNE
jgi:hypothetical protein